MNPVSRASHDGKRGGHGRWHRRQATAATGVPGWVRRRRCTDTLPAPYARGTVDSARVLSRRGQDLHGGSLLAGSGCVALRRGRRIGDRRLCAAYVDRGADRRSCDQLLSIAVAVLFYRVHHVFDHSARNREGLAAMAVIGVVNLWLAYALEMEIGEAV